MGSNHVGTRLVPYLSVPLIHVVMLDQFLLDAHAVLVDPRYAYGLIPHRCRLSLLPRGVHHHLAH